MDNPFKRGELERTKKNSFVSLRCRFAGGKKTLHKRKVKISLLFHKTFKKRTIKDETDLG